MVENVSKAQPVNARPRRRTMLGIGILGWSLFVVANTVIWFAWPWLEGRPSDAASVEHFAFGVIGFPAVMAIRQRIVRRRARD
jgi:hypothetical protein